MSKKLTVALSALVVLTACGGSQLPITQNDANNGNQFLGNWYCYQYQNSPDNESYSQLVILNDRTMHSTFYFSTFNPDDETYPGIWWSNSVSELTIQYARNGLVLPYLFSGDSLSLPSEGYVDETCYRNRLPVIDNSGA